MAKKPHVPETSLSVSIKLGIRERIFFKGILPQKAGYIKQIIAIGIINKVAVSNQEVQEFDLKDLPSGMIEWNKDKAKEKVFKFNQVEYEFLKEQVEKLDKEEGITIDLIGICKKIKEAKSGEKEDAVDT